MRNRIKQLYLDLSWWADGVPSLRWLKCRAGRHTPVFGVMDMPDPKDPAGRSEAWAEYCGYCKRHLRWLHDDQQ